MCFEMITDTNGKLTIIIDKRMDLFYLFFNGCNIFSCILKIGRKGNVDIRSHCINIGDISLPDSLFTNEQIQFLKNYI